MVPQGSFPVICYAVDSLLKARSRSEEAVRLVEAVASLKVDSITMLSLRVSVYKTVAIFLHGPRRVLPLGVQIVIHGTEVQVESQIHLGLTLDGR